MSDQTRAPGPEEQAPPQPDRTEVIDTGRSRRTATGADATLHWFDVPVPPPSDRAEIPSPAEPPSAGALRAEPGSAAYHGLNHTIPLGPALSVARRDAPPPTTRRSRRLLVPLVLALCLASGAIGGVAGQLVADWRPIGSTLPQPGPGATSRPAGSIAGIAARALPSVVTIRVRGGEGEATGSGFVIDGKGHILTNNHVVSSAGEGGAVEVVLSNGDTESATMVGRDASYDLAVLRVARTGLAPLALGASDQVVVGDEVIAVGAPLGLDQTVTSGIVSALNRPVTPGAGDEASYINAIQTDAAINPGNSGGPLLDLKGQVIGVNSAIARVPGSTSASSGNIGLGFAIPSDQARRTADQLIATGHATHPVIGVLLDRTFGGEGAQVSTGKDAVTPGGPADKAGVRPGDVIVGFDGSRVGTPDQLVVSIRSRAVGDTVRLRVQRGGEQLDLQMRLESAPSD
ncbi:trypsin-like peptidase domain-containing protein [Intrasporangium sp.]|uniref:S1C family serine protease n=1 Tax=Intrasporangium sp. TaxID=1925024 RepID=UPI0032213D11